MSKVSLRNVTKNFGKTEVIPRLNLEIKDGSFTVLVGPSGCGKSTLLRMIAGLEETTGGEIYIGDRCVTDLQPADRGVSMVFQSYALYPHMNVTENIGFSLRLQRRPKTEIQSEVRDAARLLKLEGYLNRRPADLSGGQRQRVAIGRAIVRHADVFLFDEPLSNLDAAHRADMRIELTELHSRLRATSIYVTHDQVEAMTMADQIVVLNGGGIEQVGTPDEIYNQPASPFVAQFIGSPKMNFFAQSIAERYNCEILGVRSEDLHVTSQTGDWGARVVHVENLGSERLIHVEGPEIGRCVSKVTPASKAAFLEVGCSVSVSIERANLHRFRAGQRLV